MNIRAFLLRLAYPVNYWFGKLHWPFTHKKTWDAPNDHLRDAYDTRGTKPGCVLLSHTRGSFTNLLIPGYWTHAAIVGPDGHVIEAIGDGVVETEISKFILSKDRVCILTPKFCSTARMGKAAVYAKNQLGRKYDYEFRGNNQAFYCAELVGYAYRDAMASEVFEPRKTLGEPTYTAQDFWDAKDKFALEWDSF
jgi:uncharacterized protein YycO